MFVLITSDVDICWYENKGSTSSTFKYLRGTREGAGPCGNGGVHFAK